MEMPNVIYVRKQEYGVMGDWIPNEHKNFQTKYIRHDIYKNAVDILGEKLRDVNKACDTYQKQRDEEVLLNYEARKRLQRWEDAHSEMKTEVELRTKIAELEAILEARGM